MRSKGALWTVLGVVAGVAGAYWLARQYEQARASCPAFLKRVYARSDDLVADLYVLWSNPRGLRSLRDNPLIDHPLTDKIMLAISGVNGSRSSSAAQRRYAVQHGLAPREIDSLLQGHIDHATVGEAPALVFAQHYAEQGGKPDADMEQRLVEIYGQQTAQDLVLYMRIVTLGNLVGNTIDALWSRILGQPCPDSTLREEIRVLAIFILGFVPLIPVLAIRTQRGL